MSDYAINEADRRVANLISIGRVTAVAGTTARVQIGDLKTAAIPVAAIRAGRSLVYWMPSVGEQVVVAAPSGDMARAVVLCSLFASNAPVSDPAMPVIDLTGGDMVIKGGTVRIEADVEVTGEVTVSKTVKATQGITSSAGITATGDIIASGVSLRDHTHPGDSGGVTGAPS